MIHIFFVPGMFGSMIEMVLRAFTNLDGTLIPALKDDGSAHTFAKQHHPLSLTEVILKDKDIRITTPIYPFEETKLPQILSHFSASIPSWSEDKKILIYASDMNWAEINLLFQYYKISIGLNKGLEIFENKESRNDIKKWNRHYENYRQLSRWEYREWFSLFYPIWIQEWVDSKFQVTQDFLIISNQMLMESTESCMHDIIQFCGLDIIEPLNDFVAQYRIKQQYILDEYTTIQRIMRAVLHGQDYSWSPLSIVSESILQHHCRCANLEWRCDGLDKLPTNTLDLVKIMYQPEKDLHA